MRPRLTMRKENRIKKTRFSIKKIVEALNQKKIKKTIAQT